MSRHCHIKNKDKLTRPQSSLSLSLGLSGAMGVIGRRKAFNRRRVVSLQSFEHFMTSFLWSILSYTIALDQSALRIR